MPTDTSRSSRTQSSKRTYSLADRRMASTAKCRRNVISVSASLASPPEQSRAGRFSDARPALPIGHLSIDFVLGYFGAAQGRELMARAALWPRGGSPPRTVSKVAFWHLCVEGMSLSNDEANGCTGRPLPRWTWATVFAAVNQMETLGDGLRKFAELSAVIPGEINVTLSYSSAGVHVTFRSTGSGGDPARRERYVESIALAFHCMLIWVTGEVLRPIHIRLSGRLAEADGSLLSGLSKQRTRHGDGATVVYDRSATGLAMGVRKYQAWCSHETSTFLQIVALLEYEDYDRECQTVELVRQLISGRIRSQADAARTLGLSTATLRRRLSSAGTSFRQLSRAVKLEQMLLLLATDQNLDDVAADLGFSDRRSLWRTCQAWIGMSPSVYRLNRRRQDRVG
jgi:AraC-like DNA-binding protein